MAIVPMKKIQIVAHKAVKAELLDLLQELGMVQIIQSEQETFKEEQFTLSQVSYQEIDETLNNLKQMVGFLLKNTKKSFPGKFMLDKNQLAQIIQHFNFKECFYQCRQAEEDLNKLQNKKQVLKTQIQQLMPWLETDVKLADLGNGQRLVYLTGHIKLKREAALKEELAQKVNSSYYEFASRDKNNTYFMVMVLSEDKEKALEILRKYDFNQTVFPKLKATPKRLHQRLCQELQRVNRKLEHLLGHIHRLAEQIPKLLSLMDYFRNIREHRVVQNSFFESDKTFVVSGWLLGHKENYFRKAVSAKFDEIEILVVDPEPGESPPVKIENKKVIKPFEVITDLYGYPVYTGIDPTAYLAPFFAVFFGICLGDAGYGFTVALICGFLLWKLKSKLSPASWRFLNLFFISGLFAIVAGTAMGSWFGISTSFKLFDPLSQLTVFLGLAFGLGLIHVFTGLIIKMTENIRDNGWWAGLWDQGAWMILIVALIMLGFASMLNLSATIAHVSTFMAVVGAGFIVLFQARSEDKNVSKNIDLYHIYYLGLITSLAFWLSKTFPPLGGLGTLIFTCLVFYKGRKNIKGIFARIGLGVYNLYGITSYLGDVLSYSRLVALGLGGGVIAMVVNTMAGIAKDLIPVVGIGVAVIIIIFGHLLNLSMSLLSAFVHTSRLQYVEFFGKFYTSGGKKFKPFSFEYNNIILMDRALKKK